MREKFSLLRCISWVSHSLLSLIILGLLLIVASFGVHYYREENLIMTLVSAGVFAFGVLVFINAWRLRLTEL
jgi:hypothetical protein